MTTSKKNNSDVWTSPLFASVVSLFVARSTDRHDVVCKWDLRSEMEFGHMHRK
jgi:hypothetical protein